jgi:hypothetical protein
MPQFEYYECFCCENNFTQESALEAGVSTDYATEYCSPKCQEEFLALCAARAAQAIESGLIDTNGEIIRPKSNTNSVLNLLEQYKIKVTP